MHLKKIPPKLATRLLNSFLRSDLAEEVRGDLEEKFYKDLATKSHIKAKLNYWYEVLNYLRPFAIQKSKSYLNNYDMFQNYFKIGWRNLVHNKGYSFIKIGGLAMGITVTILISLWIYDELSFDKDNTNYDRIAQVKQHLNNNGELDTWTSVPYPLAEELRTNYGNDFKHIVMAVQWGDHILTFDDKKIKEKGVYFEKEAPEMLGLKIVKGSASLNDPASILLSASAAKTYFGNEDPINTLMKIDELPDVKVIGVYEDFPYNSTFAGLNFISTWDLLYANTGWMKTIDDPWRPNFTTLFVQLNDNADINIVSAKIKDAKLKKGDPQLDKKKPELFLHPMSKWHLYSAFKNGVNVGGAIQYVWMFSVISIFVLLLACINFMNLSTARNEKRAKEVGVRKTIGSLKSQLVLQFFSESLLTVFLAFVCSALLVKLALPLFNEIANKQILIVWTNPFLWLISFSFVVITAILAGSYPAFYLSSFKPLKVLKGTFKAGRYAAVPRQVLVVVQFTVSITLIIGTIIVYQQIQFAKNRPVGYTREGLLSITIMNPSIHNHFNAVKNELMQTGTIISIAESQSPTTGIWNSTSGFSWKGKDPNLSIDFGVVNGSHDFGKTIGWHIKEGRDFSRDFLTDSSAIILNETAVHYMSLKNPIGDEVTWWGQHYTVIGVINDMVMESPYGEPRPVIYSLSTEDGNFVNIKVNPAVSTKEALSKIEPIFKKYNPDQPFEYQFADDDYAKKFNSEERIGKLASFFATLAIFISCLGIFGLASFSAEQRTKEIGIRKVLGASVATLWQMLSKDFVVLVILSCFIAAPLSYYYLHQWLLNYDYHTEITWWIFVASALGALLVTLATVSFQAIKAAMMNPVNSLKSE